jgi:hypothetical protein
VPKLDRQNGALLSLAAVAALAGAGALSRRGSRARGDDPSHPSPELVRRVADTFHQVIKEDLTPQQRREVDRRNVEFKTTHPGMSICATHDFIDANMSMLEAMERVGVDTDDSDNITPLWNAAWAMAKQQGYSED